MADSYWDDVAKVAAEKRARGKIGNLYFVPLPENERRRKCSRCGKLISLKGVCRCPEGPELISSRPS